MDQKLNEVEVLLVEDNMSDAELITRALRKVNLSKFRTYKRWCRSACFIFAKGDSQNVSLKKFRRSILPDIRMPRVDRIEVLRRLKGTRIPNQFRLLK